jgi:2-polyprenyl-6-methoxyphenol hydroxylase-like FAD-dependent oxidoreductase
MKVVVAGAGPAGLCQTHRLRSRGTEVRVHERDARPDDRRLGYRVNLNVAGRVALDVCLDDPTCDAVAAVLHQQADPVATVRTAEGRLLRRRTIPGQAVAVDRTAPATSSVRR